MLFWNMDLADHLVVFRLIKFKNIKILGKKKIQIEALISCNWMETWDPCVEFRICSGEVRDSGSKLWWVLLTHRNILEVFGRPNDERGWKSTCDDCCMWYSVHCIGIPMSDGCYESHGRECHTAQHRGLIDTTWYRMEKHEREKQDK